jgi:hypothetical protein
MIILAALAAVAGQGAAVVPPSLQTVSVALLIKPASKAVPAATLIVRSADQIYPTDVVPVPAVPIHVRVMVGSQQLFNDTFRVSRTASANYSQSRSEASEAACATVRNYSSQERYSLNINLYLSGESLTTPMVNVSVSWQRPTKTLSCSGEGSRQVQVSQNVLLPAGQSVTIEGDAGLMVTISR